MSRTSTGRITGRVACITGGASGIGAGIARRFVAEGARVVLFDRAAEPTAALAAELCAGAGAGAEVALAVVGDVRDEDAVARMAETARDRFGRLDVGVNCAGSAAFSAITDHSPEAFRDVVDVCLTGVMLSIKHEARAMEAGGSIISIASLNARQPAAGLGAYCAAKAGVEMLTKVAALELGPRGIRVNAIGPGLIDTPMAAMMHAVAPIHRAFLDNTPLGRSGVPADIAAAALFLASDDSAWMTGELLLVDGGGHLQRYPDLPGILAGLPRPAARTDG
jgi:3-oxoacyl-[acyl-carrier protein] reductase